MNEIEIGRATESVARGVRINNKSDFPLAIRLIRDGRSVAWPDVDFQLYASVNGCLRPYKAYRTGDYFVNCKKGNDGELICFFDNHGLHDGTLCIEVTLFYPDENYKVDGFRQETFTTVSNIHLVKDSGDALDLSLASGENINNHKMSDAQQLFANAAIKAADCFANATGLKEDELRNAMLAGILLNLEGIQVDDSSPLWDSYADFSAKKSFKGVSNPIVFNNREKELEVKLLPQNMGHPKGRILCKKLTITPPYKGLGNSFVSASKIDVDELVINNDTETSADQMRSLYACLRDSDTHVKHLIIKGNDFEGGDTRNVHNNIIIISPIKGLKKITLDHTKNASKKVINLIKQNVPSGVEVEFLGDYDGSEDAIVVDPVDQL